MSPDDLQPREFPFEYCRNLREFFRVRPLFLEELFRFLLRLSDSLFLKLGGAVGGVREDADMCSVHFDYPAGDSEEMLLPLLPEEDGSGGKDAEEWDMVRKDGDFPLGSGEGNGVDIVLEDDAVGGDEFKVESRHNS